MGYNEYLDLYNKGLIENKQDIVLIAIHEPSGFVHPASKIEGFHDVLQMQFWDIEKPIANYTVITDEQGKEIRDFIFKHKDKRFLIHCAAGKSRSAAVGCAVECIVRHNGNNYNYQTDYSNIVGHPRYSPNWTVYDKIIKGSDAE